jgi:arylsulfatase A-like enzyme
VIPWCEVPEASLADCPNLPPNHPRQPQEPEAIAHWRAGNPGRSRAAAYDPDRWRQFRHAYYRLAEYVDGQIGRILDAIDQAGRAKDTVVIFSSDHGDMAGAHELNQKWVLYEESSRIPLIVRDPMGGRRGEVDARLVSNGLDLLPTLCSYAGIDPPGGLPGGSWRPLIRGEASEWRDYVPVETVLDSPGAGWARMIRTERYAYHLYASGRHREQLYDLEADPGQMVNLAVESRYADVLHEHRQRLADWCRSTNDRTLTHYTHPNHLAVPGLGWIPREG